MPQIERSARILILGAGPGGLSAAHYLRRQGYQNVTIFEKLGRVGGLCRSITEDNQSFDLGALVISPAYREIRRLARRVGARLERVEGAAAFRIDDGGESTPYHRMLYYLAGGSSAAARWSFYLLCLHYLWKRFRIRHQIPDAGWAGTAAHTELGVSFAQWLRDNDLEGLTRLFEIPVTAFGYGDLDEIAAPYVLRYASPASFLALLFSAARFSWLVPSCLLLRRFRYGFQRFWERLAVLQACLGGRFSQRLLRRVGADPRPEPHVLRGRILRFRLCRGHCPLLEASRGIALPGKAVTPPLGPSK